MRPIEFITSIAGVPSPRIMYGTAWKKEDTEALVRTAIRTGFRGLDTACQPRHYNEAGVGAALAAALKDGLRRTDVYVQSKFTSPSGQDPETIPYDPEAPLATQVAQSFATSLRNLQTNYLDCLVLHSPLADPRRMQAVWGAMEQIANEGGARQLGISNCYSVEYLETLHRTARVKPAVVQNRFYAETGYDTAIRDFCNANGLIYQSFWTLTANRHVLADRRVKQLGLKYECTPAQVFFRHLTQEGVVPLTGTRSEAHMREDLEIFSFALEVSEREGINELLAA